jgi:hypothetical protein
MSHIGDKSDHYAQLRKEFDDIEMLQFPEVNVKTNIYEPLPMQATNNDQVPCLLIGLYSTTILLDILILDSIIKADTICNKALEDGKPPVPVTTPRRSSTIVHGLPCHLAQINNKERDQQPKSIFGGTTYPLPSQPTNQQETYCHGLDMLLCEGVLLCLRGDGWLSFDSIAKRSVIIVLSAIFVLCGFSTFWLGRDWC